MSIIDSPKNSCFTLSVGPRSTSTLARGPHQTTRRGPDEPVRTRVRGRQSESDEAVLEWPAQKIFQTPSEKTLGRSEVASRFPLPWSAYVRLLSVKNTRARAFYEEEALRFGWSVRQLDRQIASQFHERLTLLKKKAAMLDRAAAAKGEDQITPEEAIKDPFVLEFLDLKDEYSETDLEQALIDGRLDSLC